MRFLPVATFADPCVAYGKSSEGEERENRGEPYPMECPVLGWIAVLSTRN